MDGWRHKYFFLCYWGNWDRNEINNYDLHLLQILFFYLWILCIFTIQHPLCRLCVCWPNGLMCSLLRKWNLNAASATNLSTPSPGPEMERKSRLQIRETVHCSWWQWIHGPLESTRAKLFTRQRGVLQLLTLRCWRCIVSGTDCLFICVALLCAK